MFYFKKENLFILISPKKLVESRLRVLLINPNFTNINTYGPQLAIIFPPLGLECLAAYIEDIADVQIIDNRLKTVNLKVIEKKIEKFQPDYVGISCNYSSQIYIVREIARIAKTYGTQTVVGGWHPTLVPKETLGYQAIDIIVRCEGEITFRELIQKSSPIGIPGLSYKQDGAQVHNPDREMMDLKRVRLPSRRFRSEEAKATYNLFGFSVDCIETSRGCPYSCNFCCIHNFFKKTYRQRAIPEIIKELLSTQVKNRASLIYFVDDNFAVNRKFVDDLCDAIIQNGIKKYFMTQVRVDMVVNHPDLFKKMADAGFIFLFLGLESFSDRTLEQLNKQIKFKQIKTALKILHNLGYIIQGNVIIGANLEDTKQDLESTIEISKTLNVDLPTFSLLTPFPGTELMERVLKDNLLLTKDWRNYNWSVPVIKYPHLTSDDLKYYITKAYKETQFSKPMEKIKRIFRTRGIKFHLERIMNAPMLRSFQNFLSIKFGNMNKKTEKSLV